MLQKREKKDTLWIIKAYGLKSQWVGEDWKENKKKTFMRKERTILGRKKHEGEDKENHNDGEKKKRFQWTKEERK